jgi:hypothetical protein
MFRNGSKHDKSTGYSDEDFKDGQSDENNRAEPTTQPIAIAPLPVISLHQRKISNPPVERFTVKPAYAYPKIKMTKEEMRKELNRTSSFFHDFTKCSSKNQKLIGAIHLEILQCFGLPRRDIRKKGSAFCILVCERHAFKTDVMPSLANPMLLSKHRRACVFPLHKAFSRVYIGFFSKTDGSAMDRFIGRVVLDVSRLRPGSTYDVTLPLRMSNQIYSRAKRGAVRFRIHLEWIDARAALLSYLPSERLQFCPHDKVTVRCSDNKAFQNVARVVHGHDLPGKFSMKLTKATAREVNFIRVHVFRYLWKREFRAITQWRCPVISLFVFTAWMHSVYVASLSYVPGHFVTIVLLYLWKNYTLYILDPNHSKGFSMPYVEEMMTTLLFGSGIESLQMEREDQWLAKNNEHCDDESDPQSPSLQELAKIFWESVPRIKRRRLHANAFLGRDAVSFLVDMNFASSRQDAVELGKRLQHEMSLFHHIRKRQVDFRDSDVIFVLYNIEMSSYVFKTHSPWFCSISRFLFSDVDKTRSDVHMEFPYASAVDHPRFSVHDGLDSKEPVNLLASMQDPFSDIDMDDQESIDDGNDDGEFGSMSSDGDSVEQNAQSKEAIVESFSSSFGDILRVNSTDSVPQQTLVMESSTPLLSPTLSQDDNDLDEDILNVDLNNGQILCSEEGTEILILPKPPNQDIDIVQKKDKTLSQLLQKTAVEIHSKFGHLFHDKAYRIRSKSIVDGGINEKTYDQSGTSTSKNQLLAKTSSVLASSMPQSQVAEKQQLAYVDASSELKAKRDLCDKLLRSGKYSSSNVFIGKLALVVQPLVEIVQTFLASFRASFNIMTWRDPFLSFWVLIFGILLVPVLHIFPWRVVLGVVGLVFVGPQNYVYRVIMNYFQGSKEENLDMVVRTKRQDDDDENDVDAPIFSNRAPDNRPLRLMGMSTSQDIKEVAVPQSQLLYRRCYDWPPEPEYARVTITTAPKSNPEAERLLEANQIETYGAAHMESNSDHQTKDLLGSVGGKRWALRIVNRSVASVKTVPSRFRGGRKKDV